MARTVNPKHFFSKAEEARILDAITEVERHTSGEICVHLAKRTSKDVFQAAVQVFEKLGLAKTKARNGVLIYLALKNRAFSIIGDAGIHEKVSDAFWEKLKLNLETAFQQDAFLEGLIGAIQTCGSELKKYFPPVTDNPNELPNLSK
jgi:uncharacterized membrane protein